MFSTVRCSLLQRASPGWERWQIDRRQAWATGKFLEPAPGLGW